MIRLLAPLALCLPLAFPAAAHSETSADLAGPEGEDRGVVLLTQTPNGVLLTAKLENFPEGVHAFHIHETGACDAPDFKSAGGHFNPGGLKHGILSPDGLHAGDMPNVHVPASGELTIEILNPRVTLEHAVPDTLFDADGSAIVIHEGADDYETDPAGAAGARIACGVIMGM